MNKKAALISCYCDTEEKIYILNENIKKIKSFGLDVFLISPLILPENTTKLCDYFFYIKDNFILTWPLKVQIYSVWFREKNDDAIFLNLPGYDYGWAALNHIKKLTEIALTFDYDYFYNLVYDLNIDENVIKLLENPVSDLFCGYQRREILFKPVSLHFMVFNKEKAKKIIELITLEKYLFFLNSSLLREGKDAEGFLLEIVKELKFKISDFFVKDLITLEATSFDHCKINGIKFFIEKNSLAIFSDMKIYVYENKKQSQIEIIINGKSTYINETFKVLSLGVSYLDVKSAFLKSMGETIDLMPVLESIKHSYITFGKIPI